MARSFGVEVQKPPPLYRLVHITACEVEFEAKPESNLLLGEKIELERSRHRASELPQVKFSESLAQSAISSLNRKTHDRVPTVKSRLLARMSHTDDRQ